VVLRALALNPQLPKAWSLLNGIMFSLGRSEDALAGLQFSPTRARSKTAGCS
jgi:hypothetical protein